MIDLKLMHHALTLAKYRNFARAAEALDMSQPALSRSISRAESTLGVKLFRRTPRGVETTSLGERFLSRGGMLLRDAAELERELALLRGRESGTLRVGAGMYPADMSVAVALGRLMSRHPRSGVELRTGDWRELVRDLLQAQLDIAVVELSVVAEDPRLVIEALPTHRALFYCRAGHPLLGGEPPEPERVSSYPFVGTAMPPRAGLMFYRLARTGTIDPDTGDYLPPIKIDTVTLAKSIVMSSDAVAIAPLPLLVHDIDAGRLATLPLDEPWLHTNYGFAWPKDRTLSPEAHAFMAEVRAVEAELVRDERPDWPAR